MNTKGFTLLEVTLFLAVSGALGLIAFVGLGPRLRNVRFTQSVRLVENTINNQFTASTAGQNVRPANFSCAVVGVDLQISSGGSNPAGSSANCVINGKMVFFEGDKMTFYSIVSRREPTSASCLSATQLTDVISCYTPRLTGIGSGSPPQATEATFSSGVSARFPSAPTSDYRGYGYIQSPNGVKQYPFFFTDPAVTNNLTTANTSVANGPLKVCLELSNRQAELAVESSTIKPTISFEGCTF